MKGEHLWYIAPGGCLGTNKLLAEHLPAENACEGMKCADGEERDLWRCDHAMVTEMERAREDLNLTFKVFVQEGHNGKIYPWKFSKSRRKVSTHSKPATIPF